MDRVSRNVAIGGPMEMPRLRLSWMIAYRCTRAPGGDSRPTRVAAAGTYTRLNRAMRLTMPTVTGKGVRSMNRTVKDAEPTLDTMMVRRQPSLGTRKPPNHDPA